MKLSKKLKKKLAKFKSRAKDWINAQVYYAKKAAHSAFTALKVVTATFLMIFTIIATVLVADRAHKEYLEHYIGDQVLFVTNTPESKVKGSATGFHVKAKSGNVIFVTNAHVCELKDDKNILMVQDTLNSQRLVPRRVLEIYKDNDLCAVEPLPGYEGLSLADDLSVGEPVWAIGYPLGESLNISNGRVKDFGTTSLISRIPIEQCHGPNLSKQTVQYWFFITEVCVVTFESVQTDVVIYGGNSGSPLLNIWGNVTGVVFAANTRTNWGRAVPLDHLKKLLSAY